MASKEVMQKEIVEEYDTYERSFREVGITREALLKYLEKFKGYDDIRKVYRFFFSVEFLVKVRMIKEALKLFPTAEAWIALKIHTPNERNVKYLRELVKDAKKAWAKRPKAPRRGSE